MKSVPPSGLVQLPFHAPQNASSDKRSEGVGDERTAEEDGSPETELRLGVPSLQSQTG
jgi:hypothetical protein